MRIAVVSLFPVMLREALMHGVFGRALERGVVEVEYFDPRDLHQRCAPNGGRSAVRRGPGMVLKVEPLRDALRAARAALPPGSRSVYLGADGRRFEQSKAREARDWPGLVLVAGRYEGVDERFIESEIDEQWSIGDYVLTGGELPALVVIDAIARLLPGTLGSAESALQESFNDGLGRLAALYAAGVGRRSRGARGAGVRRSCGDPALAFAAGARTHVVAPAGTARAARNER